MTPTRLYVPAALAAVRAGGVSAIAHITGGGLTGNLPRVLPVGFGAEIDLGRWEMPPVFRWIAERARLDDAQMLATFNCGIGMVLLAKPDAAEALVALLRRHDERVHVIGQVVEGDGLRFGGALA